MIKSNRHAYIYTHIDVYIHIYTWIQITIFFRTFEPQYHRLASSTHLKIQIFRRKSQVSHANPNIPEKTPDFLKQIRTFPRSPQQKTNLYPWFHHGLTRPPGPRKGPASAPALAPRSAHPQPPGPSGSSAALRCRCGSRRPDRGRAWGRTFKRGSWCH